MRRVLALLLLCASTAAAQDKALWFAAPFDLGGTDDQGLVTFLYRRVG